MSDAPWPCPVPEFRFNHLAKWWEACVHCGRLAWDHEQADPLQDIRNQAKMLSEGGYPWQYPPVMRRPGAPGA